MAQVKKIKKMNEKAIDSATADINPMPNKINRLLNPKRFSRPQLAIFALVFALLGGFIIYKSFAATSGTLTITQGGNYSGEWLSNSSAPAVRISTSEPVVIENSKVTNLAGGALIEADFPLAVNITIRNVQAFGGAGRFFEAEGFKTVIIENNTIDNTGGVKLASSASGSTVKISRNKHRNIQDTTGSNFGNFVQLAEVQGGSIEISWNEIINEYNKSHPEDIVSLYKTANARIHDNYFQHSSTPGNAYNTSSQGTVTVESSDSAGPFSVNNEIWNNQFIDTVNGVYFGPGTSNNFAHHNRLIQDGFLPGGVTRMGNGWSGMSIQLGGTNNHMHDNISGYVNRDGQRMDWIPMEGAPEGAGSEIAKNITLPDPITQLTEQAEWTLWQQKLSASGVTLGASTAGPAPPPAPAPSPTASINANPSTINAGAGSLLSWSSSNSTSCYASGAWSGTQSLIGNITVSPSATSTYILNCTGAGGSASSSSTVNVTAPTPPPTAPPTVTLTASPSAVNTGVSSTLTWNSTNATACSASGVWTGSKAASGTQAVTPTTTSTYSLSCTGTGGTTTSSVTITVTAPPPPPPSADTTPPSTPANFRVTATGKNNVALAWDASTDNVGVAGYRLYRNNATTPLYNGLALSINNTGLSAGSTYTYYVTAYDKAGNTSPNSQKVCVSKWSFWSNFSRSRSWKYC